MLFAVSWYISIVLKWDLCNPIQYWPSCNSELSTSWFSSVSDLKKNPSIYHLNYWFHPLNCHVYRIQSRSWLTSVNYFMCNCWIFYYQCPFYGREIKPSVHFFFVSVACHPGLIIHNMVWYNVMFSVLPMFFENEARLLIPLKKYWGFGNFSWISFMILLLVISNVPISKHYVLYVLCIVLWLVISGFMQPCGPFTNMV